mmetsp:Transcript_568/g.727  ORF Transcript_568/g.727 Transcript_568/m.727 type:complete len:444 (-) Transcript_568:13-1344(-)
MGCYASRAAPNHTGAPEFTIPLQVNQNQREPPSKDITNTANKHDNNHTQIKKHVSADYGGHVVKKKAPTRLGIRRSSAHVPGHENTYGDPKSRRLAKMRRNSCSNSADSRTSSSSASMSSGSEEEFFGLDMDYKDFEIREGIGSGTYGQVFKCRYKGKLFALKKVFLPENPSERTEMLEDFAKEVGILSVLRHDRIVSFKGAVRKHPNYALLFELCEGCVGTLLRMVRRRKVQVTWSICMTIAKDCAEAVSYLHSLRPQIIHRDLKAENLLLTSRFRCKLTDFGLSRVYEGRKHAMTVCGTPCWVAPEIFRGEAYNEKIDVYSFGVVLWELFAGKKPYTEYESVELPYRVGKKGLRPPLLRHCPPSINRLMKDCWQESPALRPSFPEIQKRLASIETELSDTSCLTTPAHQTKVSWEQQLAMSRADTILIDAAPPTSRGSSVA